MRKLGLIAAVILLAGLTLSAADWLVDGYDNQRTGWQRNESILNVDNVKDMKLLWKVQTESLPPDGLVTGPNVGRNLFPPLVVDKAAMASGTKEVVVLGTVYDYLYAIDAATGQVLWHKQFDLEDIVGNCRGKQMTTPTIGPGATPGSRTIYSVASDGKLHQTNLADGTETAPAELFLPKNGSAHSLALLDGIIYTMTGDNCGSHANYIYGFNLKTDQALNFSPGSGAMWGSRGPAIGADGTAYAGTGDGEYDPGHKLYGNAIIGVKLNPKTGALDLAKYYAPINTLYMYKRDLDMNVTPTIITFKGKEYLADSSKECRVWLLDTSKFGGDNHQTEVYRTPLICNEFSGYFSVGVWGALSSWVDPSGTAWILVPFWGAQHSEFKAPIQYGPVTKGAVAAFKLEDKGGKVQLTPAWVTEDIGAPGSVVVANGIVFAYKAGADTTITRHDVPVGETPNAPTRLQGSTPSVLYAFDGQTGKKLWSSGNQIASFNHQSGLTVANGKVYIGTFDGVEYCFGLGK